MAALDRLYNIAQTGQTDEPTAVDNIMAQYKPKNQGGFWNGVKTFAGSNSGRMLLGGLAGTALGALGGRNLNEALTGGIMGATGAAKGITMRGQYNDMIARQQQERADRLKQIEDGRNFQREMQQNNLAAQKEAADLAFERRLQELDADREFRRELAAEARRNAVADRQSDYEFRTKLANDQFERQKTILGLNQDFAREGWQNTADREDARYQRGIEAEIARENREDARYNRRLNDTRAYNAGLIADQRDYDNQLWQRNQEAEVARENRANELYKSRLDDQRKYEAEVLKNKRDYEAGLRADQRAYDSERLADERAYNEERVADERTYQDKVRAADYAQQADLVNMRNFADTRNREAVLDYKRKEAEKKEADKAENDRKNMNIAISGINTLQNLADSDVLDNFSQSSWNIYPSDTTRQAQGQLSSAVAAIAPTAIQRLKDAGVSGVNTLGEFMTYVGLPEKPTSQQIAGALPLIKKILNVETGNSGGFVRVQAPDGRIFNIPETEAQNALNQGGRII